MEGTADGITQEKLNMKTHENNTGDPQGYDGVFDFGMRGTTTPDLCGPTNAMSQDFAHANALLTLQDSLAVLVANVTRRTPG